MITAIVGILTGGGATAAINLILDHSRSKQSAKNKEIDDRIIAWQKINEKTERRLAQLENKLESCERDFRSLERYVNALEHMILRTVPPVELPDRPILERDQRDGDV